MCLLELIDELSRRGSAVQLHLAAPWPGRLTEAVDGRVPVVLAPARWWTERDVPSVLRRILATVKILLTTAGAVRVLVRLRPDVVVTNSIVTPAAALAARALGIPHIWYVHEYGAEDHGFSFVWGRSRTLRAVERLSVAVVTNSQAVRSTLFPDSRKAVVSHCAVVVPDGLVASPTGAGRLLLLGQLRPTKGHLEALEAVRLLRESGQQVSLTIAGDGPADYRAQLRAVVRDHGLEDAVTFRDYTTDPLGLMCDHDLLLMCSRREAFGRVVVEAMKVGLPVVGTESGGPRELLAEGRGWTYAAGDPTSLATTIERALLRAADDNTVARARAWARDSFRADTYADEFLENVSNAVSVTGVRPLGGQPSGDRNAGRRAGGV